MNKFRQVADRVPEKTYLGYGVNAEASDLNELVLSVERVDGQHHIALTRYELNGLIEFADRMGLK